MKKITFVFICCVLMLTGCSRSRDDEQKEMINVTLEIICTNALQGDCKDDIKELLPTDGMILNQTEISIEAGSTVFEALLKATSDNKIEINYTGLKSAPYVKSIAGLSEFDCGALSGWIYTVNDEISSSSSGKIKLNEEDKIKFIYSCELGNDIE